MKNQPKTYSLFTVIRNYNVEEGYANMLVF